MNKKNVNTNMSYFQVNEKKNVIQRIFPLKRKKKSKKIK